MALPTSAFVLRRPTAPRAGVTVECYPSTIRGLSVELQVATANSTLSSKWNSVAILPPTSAAAMRFTLRGLESTKSMFIRARHPAQPGYSAGPYTPVISAKPKLAPDIQRPMLPQLTYKGNVEIPAQSDVYVSSAQTAKVGTQVTTGFIIKNTRINASKFVPESTAQHYARGVGSFLNSAAGSSNQGQSFQASLDALPVGITITQFQARGKRTTDANALLGCGLYKVSTAGVATLLTQLTFTASNTFQTQTSTAMSEVLSTSFSYLARTTLKTGVGNHSITFQACNITYKTGTYTRTI